MKENLDNHNANSKKDIKNLMKYFNYNVKKDSVSKNDSINNILNKNKSKINISTIFKEYINENKNENENKNKNNIILDDNNLYHEIVNKNLIELRNNTISYLDDIKKKIQEKYLYFSDNLSKWLKKKDKKLTKIISNSENPKLYLNYMKENIFDKIKKIIELHDNIFKSIKDQFSLLNLFLEENNLINDKCPQEEFVLKNSNFILNSWLLSKINMEPFCLSKFLDNNDLSDLFKNYYSKKKEGILFNSIYLKNDNKKNYSYEPNISKHNFFKINKLKLKSMSGDSINKIYTKISKGNDFKANENNNKIKTISLSNLDLFSSAVENLSKINFPVLEKIIIKKCFIPYNCHYLFQMFISKTSNLKSIKIEYVKLTDKSFNEFMSFIIKNKSILDSIQCLSFKDNNLNYINLDNLLKNKLNFNNLKEFNLSNNNIYNFSAQNLKKFPKLQILDLSNNNINNNLLFEGIRKGKANNIINFIALMCKNIFLYNVGDNNQKYIDYLKENLIDFKYNIKNINLGFLYNKKNREDLSNLLFSPMIKLTLIKLDLSYCGLNDNCLSNFLKNNFDLISLTNLNLSNNFFTIKFFSLCSSLNINGNESENILLEKIKIIDLSFNAIKCQSNNDLLKINKYIDKHSYLKKIKFQNNDLLNIFKKTEKNDEYKNELKNLVALCINRNVKFIIQTELFTSIDNDTYKKFFIFKNNFY